MSDIKDGLPHSTNVAGVVDFHGAAMDPPASLGVTPSRQLDIRDAAATVQTLWYTLPAPFHLFVFPGDNLQMTFKEAVGTANAPHSYGVLLTKTTTNEFVLLTEDGASGPAFTASERLGFDFAIDTQVQATQKEPVDCGIKAHYPGNVTLGTRTVHLFPGEATTFVLNGVDVTFTLLDMYRFEQSTCGAAPDYSIAYIVQPKS